MQWSSAYSGRHRDPAAMDRLRARVRATLDALAGEVSAALPTTRASLVEEMGDINQIATALNRMDAQEEQSSHSNSATSAAEIEGAKRASRE